MSCLADSSTTLREALEKLARESKARAVAVALLDLESDFRFSLAGDRWFHAASTIKLAVLLAIFRAADEGRLRLDDSLHVRNRFVSAADGSPFRVDPSSDAMPELYQAIGRTAKISALAEGMIVASSNLATNLLLDFLGVEYARNVLRDAQVSGVELRRGVQDRAAHEKGIDNEATADGLLTLLSALRGDFLKKESKEQAIQVLLAQRFNSMIPAGIIELKRCASKTWIACSLLSFFRKSPRNADNSVSNPSAVASLSMPFSWAARSWTPRRNSTPLTCASRRTLRAYSTPRKSSSKLVARLLLATIIPSASAEIFAVRPIAW